MIVTIDEKLSERLIDTGNHLIRIKKAHANQLNDRVAFRPALGVLDRLTVAVHAAKVPQDSFLTTEAQSLYVGPRFELHQQGGVSKALTAAIEYLRGLHPEAYENDKNLSTYSYENTKEVITLIHRLYFSILESVREQAGRDLSNLSHLDVSQFLDVAEHVRSVAGMVVRTAAQNESEAAD